MTKKLKKVKAPAGSAAAVDPPVSKALRRHYKDKARRQRLLEKHPKGFKDRFVMGCFFLGAVALVLFLTTLFWGVIKAKFFE